MYNKYIFLLLLLFNYLNRDNFNSIPIFLNMLNNAILKTSNIILLI